MRVRNKYKNEYKSEKNEYKSEKKIVEVREK